MSRDRIRFSKPYRRENDRKLGARATVVAQRGPWLAAYHFDTHGMNEAEVAEKTKAIEMFHVERADRLDGFVNDIRGREYVVGGETLTVVDCTLFDGGRPGEIVQLYVDLRIIDGKRLRPVQGFPIKRRYTSISEVPSDEEIVAMIEAALPVPEDIADKHDKFAKRVDALLRGN